MFQESDSYFYSQSFCKSFNSFAYVCVCVNVDEYYLWAQMVLYVFGVRFSSYSFPLQESFFISFLSFAFLFLCVRAFCLPVSDVAAGRCGNVVQCPGKPKKTYTKNLYMGGSGRNRYVEFVHLVPLFFTGERKPKSIFLFPQIQFERCRCDNCTFWIHSSLASKSDFIERLYPFVIQLTHWCTDHHQSIKIRKWEAV